MSTIEICSLCGVASCGEYSRHVTGVYLCSSCCEMAANAYSMAHSGSWLTWKNPPADPPKKVKIPRSMAKAVFERDAYRCVTCGSHIDLTCDHVIPESKGGPATLDNLQTMCRSCNCRKGVSINSIGVDRD